jgi:1-acyl-sn-glycerol-3-phosphate acyltransferase
MRSKISAWILKLLGWRITGIYPNSEPKNVLAVVPHTSWVDFPLGLLVRSARKMDTRFLGKASLFKGPMGGIFKWLGGYPVDRRGNQKMVDAVADIFNAHDKFDIAIAPEGTRKKVDKLRSGFYYIAKKSGAAIVLVTFDFGNKVVHFSDPIYPTDDESSDLKKIEDYFRGVQGKKIEYSF